VRDSRTFVKIFPELDVYSLPFALSWPSGQQQLQQHDKHAWRAPSLGSKRSDWYCRRRGDRIFIGSRPTLRDWFHCHCPVSTHAWMA